MMHEWTFRDELRLNPINLPRAALHFARDIAYPNLDVAHYVRVLDDLTLQARQAVEKWAPVTAQLEALCEFLFHEFGLRGNELDYFDPRNSFLNEVLDRRLGIPISISIIFVSIAQSLELSAYGISLPGHFIVGVRDRDEDLLLDPFQGGRRLTTADCAELVRTTSGYKGEFEKSWLVPAAPRDVLVRMLNNLRMVYVQREAWPETLSVIEHLRMVQPEQAEHLRDLGLLHYQTGSMRKAAQYLEAFVTQNPEAPEVKTIRENVWQSFDKWARAN